MKKVLKILGILVGVLLGSALAVGFLADPKFDSRFDFVIDAPVGKVWDIVSDPKRVGEWMPIRSEDERITEVKTAGGLEKLASGLEQVAKTGDVKVTKLARHTYVHKNGAETTVEVESRETNKVYTEHVIEDTTGMAKMFPDMHWGYELAAADGGKTRLTPFMYGTAAKPHGTLVNKIMTWLGAGRKYQEQMAKNVETLAKGGKVQ